MKLFFHFSVAGFSNTYLLGDDDGGDAILIDPGAMNVSLLKMIEGNDFYIRSVLVTHAHSSHVLGIKTLKRIYDFDIYANTESILGFPCKYVHGGEKFELSDITVKAIDVSGHSSDSLVFNIDHMLFTGDALGGGRVGATRSAFAKALLTKSIREKILTLDGDFLILPGHGAPSTVEAERSLNPVFKSPEH
jgi:hydroxyacylglutathione hydrolase